MPVLTFKNPEGKTIKVNSPDGSMPSEKELDQLFALSPSEDRGGMAVAGPLGFGAGNPKKAIEQGKNLVRDLTKPIVQSLARPVQAASIIAGGPTKFKLPFYGDITPDQGGKPLTSRDLIMGAASGPSGVGVNHPELEKPIGTAAQTLATVMGPEAGGGAFFGGKAAEEGKGAGEVLAKTAIGAGLGKLGEMVASGIGRMMAPATDSVIDKAIAKEVEKGVSKGVRPSVAGKGTASKVGEYYQNAVDGVKAIIQNKGDLKFQNESGQLESRLPKSTADYASAIEQTKKSIYEKYTALAKQAGDKGAGFNLKPIWNKIKADILDTKKFSPEIREYALNRLKSLKELNGADPLTVQARIQELNSTLESFYRGGAMKINADIDATIAKMMREELDKTITSKTGTAYKPLKRLYGSLLALEKDVNHRALVYARQVPKGLLDGATDLFTGERLTSGLVKAITGNPIGAVTDAGQAVTVKAMNLLRQKINNPDRIIEGMFRNVDGWMTRAERIAAKRAAGQAEEAAFLKAQALKRPIDPNSSEAIYSSPGREMGGKINAPDPIAVRRAAAKAEEEAFLRAKRLKNPLSSDSIYEHPGREMGGRVQGS